MSRRITVAIDVRHAAANGDAVSPHDIGFGEIQVRTVEQVHRDTYWGEGSPKLVAIEFTWQGDKPLTLAKGEKFVVEVTLDDLGDAVDTHSV